MRQWASVLIYDLVLYYYTVVGTILINDWIEANNRYLLLVWISISHVYVSNLEIVKVNKKLSATETGIAISLETAIETNSFF